MTLVLDAGALDAAERGHRGGTTLNERERRAGRMAATAILAAAAHADIEIVQI